MIHFKLRRIIAALSLTGTIFSPTVHASAFQLFEQDGASVGNYHAGYAAWANDASTAFYNPAGITRIKNQQFVFSADTVLTDFKYQGNIRIDTIDNNAPFPVTAQGGIITAIPAMHYVAPLSDDLGFGFSVAIPFGLETNYGKETFVRYAATESSIEVIDISPALGYQITPKFSLGAGFDIQRLNAQFNQVGGNGYPDPIDATSTNKASDTGYGGHFGALYEFSDNTRVGLSYHTQVVHHMNGSSSFTGPLAEALDSGPFSSQAWANITLPPYTALSAYHKLKFLPKLSVMASMIHTQWNVIRTLTLNGVSAIQELDPSTHVQIVVPQYFRNTWNVSAGANYDATDTVTLKAGLGFDQTPVSDNHRNVQMPDNNRVAIACGGHYQANHAIGLDLGWLHLFMPQASVNVSQPEGDETVTSNGHVNGGADVFSAQLTWNLV